MSSIFDLMTAEPEAEEYNASAEVVSGAGGGQQARIAKWTMQRVLQVWGAEPMSPEMYGLPPADGVKAYTGKGAFFYYNPIRRDDANQAAKLLGAVNNRQFADEVLLISADLQNILNGGDKDISASVSVGAWPGENGRAPKKMWVNAGYQLMSLPSIVQAIAVANGMMKQVYDYNNVVGAPASEEAQLHFIGTDEVPGELVTARAEIWKALGCDSYKAFTATITPAGTPDFKRKTNVTSDSNLWKIMRVIVHGHKPFDTYAKVLAWVDPPTPDVLDKNGQARNVPVMLEAYRDETAAIKAAGDEYVAPPNGKKIPQRFAAAGLSASDFQDFLNGIMKAMPSGAVAKDWIRTGPGLAVMKANDLGDALDIVAEWL